MMQSKSLQRLRSRHIGSSSDTSATGGIPTVTLTNNQVQFMFHLQIIWQVAPWAEPSTFPWVCKYGNWLDKDALIASNYKQHLVYDAIHQLAGPISAEN